MSEALEDIILDDVDLLISNYAANAGSAMVVYEYIITLGSEIELFWTGKITGATILFFVNRYLSLVVDVSGLVENMPISDKVNCPDVARSSKAINILQYVPWAAFSALRGFALTRNWPLATLILLLSLAPVGINFAHFAFHPSGENFFTGCLSTDDVSTELNIKMTIISRTCLITADVILIYVTWFNMYRHTGPRHPAVKNRYLDVLLRNGTIYFVVLAILNSLHLTLSLLSIEYKFNNISYVTQFSEPLTTVLVSRFLIDLQAASRRVLHISSLDDTLSAYSHLETLDFGGRFVGSLGEALSPGVAARYNVKPSVEVEVDLEGLDKHMGFGMQDPGESLEMTTVPLSTLRRHGA